MWTVQLSYGAGRLPPSQRQELADMLGAIATYDADRRRLTLTVEVVDATTVRQAADTAVRRCAEAVATVAAGAMSTRPTQLRVLPTQDHIAEVDHPGPVEQMGVTEIAALLGVSRQRVNQLITGEAFPAPVSRLAAGPVFTTASIRAFKQRWERQPGRPWHKTKTIAPLNPKD